MFLPQLSDNSYWVEACIFSQRQRNDFQCFCKLLYTMCFYSRQCLCIFCQTYGHLYLWCSSTGYNGSKRYKPPITNPTLLRPVHITRQCNFIRQMPQNTSEDRSDSDAHHMKSMHSNSDYQHTFQVRCTCHPPLISPPPLYHHITTPHFYYITTPLSPHHHSPLTTSPHHHSPLTTSPLSS